MAVITVAAGFGLNMNMLSLAELWDGDISGDSRTVRVDLGAGYYSDFTGAFTISNGFLTGGTITGITNYQAGAKAFTVTGLNVDGAQFLAWVDADATAAAYQSILAGADTITGGNLRDVLGGLGGKDKIYGNGGDDDLFGGDGNDLIDGGTGEDWMFGGAGNDTFYVQNQNDIVFESKGEGTDLIYSSVSFSLAGQYVEKLTLTGSAAINATGNTLGNTIVGNAGANVINGGKGADIMTGGAGSDIYYVDSAGDRVVETKVAGVDLIYSSVSYTLAGQYVEKLDLTGSGSINATGNTLDNTIIGNDAANVIDGVSGRDRIRGDGGADILTGGSGADVFVYDRATDSTLSAFDRITDLSNSDKIDLSDIDANTGQSGNQGFSLVDSFTKAAGQMTLDYSSSTKLTTILMDVNGDGKADMKIVVNGDHDDFDNFVF